MIIRKYSLILSAFFILSLTLSPVSAASYSLTVYVYDSDGGNSISGAIINLDGTYKGTTGSDGKKSITGVSQGFHKATANKSGYDDASQDVSVSSNDQVTIYLKPKVTQVPSEPSYSVSNKLVSQDPISKKVFATFDYKLSAKSNKEITLSGTLRTYRGYTEAIIQVEEKRQTFWGEEWLVADNDWKPYTAFTYTYDANKVIPFKATLNDLKPQIKEYRIIVKLKYVSDFWMYPVTAEYYWSL